MFKPGQLIKTKDPIVFNCDNLYSDLPYLTKKGDILLVIDCDSHNSTLYFELIALAVNSKIICRVTAKRYANDWFEIIENV